jgi:hypothetical protein
MSDQIKSPDSLLSDPESKEFFVLRDEKLIVVRHRNELPPYLEKRSTYLSAGRFSPSSKQVAFWPDPINPSRAMELLKANSCVDDSYSYMLTGTENAARVVNKTESKNKEGLLGHLDGVRKREVEVLMEHGKMTIQKNDRTKGSNG